MAQAGYTPIQLYFSTTAAAVPLAANLAQGELAINIADGKLYYENSSGVVTLLASSTTVTNSFSAGTTGFTPSTATTGAVTLGGTLITSNGGTGLSSYTAGDLSYYASGTALTKLAIGTAGQFLTSTGTAPQWSTLSGVAVTTFSAGTTGFTPNTATSGAITLAGTLATTNGGTGLTSFTSGGVVYASSTSALATNAGFTFNGSLLALDAASSGATSEVLRLSNSGSGANTQAQLKFYTTSTNYGTISGGYGSGSPQMTFDLPNGTPGVYVWQITSSEQMRLTSTGLKVGTTSDFASAKVVTDGGGIGILNKGLLRSSTNGVLQVSADPNNAYASSQISFDIDGSTVGLFDSAGNLGLGVTPSAWDTAVFRTLQVGTGVGSASLSGRTDGIPNATLGINVYYGTGAYRYIGNGTANYYNQQSGVHSWHTAASGTAGNAISFTQAMTLDASGNLAIGTTTVNSANNDVLTVGKTSNSQDVSLVVRQFGNNTAANLYLIANDNNGAPYNSISSSTYSGTTHWKLGGIGGFTGGLAISTSGSERARIDASGNLGLGVTPSAWSGFVALQVTSGLSLWSSGVANSRMNANTYYNGGYKYIGTGTATMYEQDGYHAWYQAASGTAGNAITFTQAMTLDASGNLGIGTTSPTTKLSITDSTGPIIRMVRTSNRFEVSADTDFMSLNARDASTYITFKTADTERARINSAGQFLIGATSANGLLTLKNTSPASSLISIQNYSSTGEIASIQLDQSTDVWLFANKTATGSIAFGTGYGSERARIDSSGNFLLGNTSVLDYGKITIKYAGSTENGISITPSDGTSATGYIMFENESNTRIGSITRATTTNAVLYNTTSDYRLKTVTGSVIGQGARIDALKPIDYQWTDGGQQARGFLAHEFQTVYPNSVSGDKDAVDANGNPKYQAMQAATSEVIADLVAEIQSLRKRLADAGI